MSPASLYEAALLARADWARNLPDSRITKTVVLDFPDKYAVVIHADDMPISGRFEYRKTSCKRL